MGIHIKGMEMPRACVYRINGHLITCPLYDIDGYCRALNTEASHKENEKPSCCPLVIISSHGRLIDADTMITSIKRQTDFLKVMGGDLATIAEVLEKGFLQEIENAPTIIEAEEVEK